jgi:hypothetical protein
MEYKKESGIPSFDFSENSAVDAKSMTVKLKNKNKE